MLENRTMVPAGIRRLSIQVFDRFCSLYYQRLTVANRGNAEFSPERWWGRPGDDGVWQRAARFFVQQPEPWPEFVGWLFKSDADGRTAKLPEPAYLHSPKHWRAFVREYASLAYQQELRSNMALELSLQDTQFDMAVQDAVDAGDLGLAVHDGTRAGILRRALNTAEITPLVACCLALEQGLTDVARQFREAAWDQYWPYAALYDEIWGRLIPHQLKSEYTNVMTKRKGNA